MCACFYLGARACVHVLVCVPVCMCLYLCVVCVNVPLVREVQNRMSSDVTLNLIGPQGMSVFLHLFACKGLGVRVCVCACACIVCLYACACGCVLFV